MRPRRSPAKSALGRGTSHSPAPRSRKRRGRRASRPPRPPPPPSRKGGLDMASREKELAGLPPGSDSIPGRLAALMDRLVGPFRYGVPPPPRPATGFYTDTTVCIGCKACQVACKQWNQLPADGFNWTGNSYDNTGELSATSWRHVKFVEQFTPPPPNSAKSGSRI